MLALSLLFRSYCPWLLFLSIFYLLLKVSVGFFFKKNKESIWLKKCVIKMFSKQLASRIWKVQLYQTNCREHYTSSLSAVHWMLSYVQAPRLCNLHMESSVVGSLWLQFVTVKKEIDSKLKCADKRVSKCNCSGFFCHFWKKWLLLCIYL